MGTFEQKWFTLSPPWFFSPSSPYLKSFSICFHLSSFQRFKFFPNYSGTSWVAQLVKNSPVMQETPIQFLGPEIPWRRDRLPTAIFLGYPSGSDGKECTCNVGDLGSITGLGRFPEGKSWRHGNPLQYSCLENPHRLRSLAVYSPQGHKELDTTEWLSTQEFVMLSIFSCAY